MRGRPEVVLSWVPKGCRCLLTGLQAQRDWVYEELGFAASGGPHLAAMREELPRTLYNKQWSAEQMFSWGWGRWGRAVNNHHGCQAEWLGKSDVVKLYESLSLV